MAAAAAQRLTEDGSHTYTAEARGSRRPRYREPGLETLNPYSGPMNIMFDRRVVRGNTYAAQVIPIINPLEESLGKRPAKRRSINQGTSRNVRTPEAVEGRRHINVQTDVYLEELTDKVPEVTVDTQTDPFLDRPLTPLYVPQKSGIDVATQIEEGDLFNFDLEVEPILEVLVGKTLEQALMEVMEEEELAAMRAHQEHFEQVRNAELVATQRMEAAEQRKLAEKERRLQQEKQRLLHNQLVHEKVAAQTFARGYMGGLISNVFETLRQEGVFYDPVEREVQEAFMPFLKDAMQRELHSAITAHAAMHAIVASAVESYTEVRNGADERRAVVLEMERQKREAEEARIRAEAEAKAAIELYRRSRVIAELILAAQLTEEDKQTALTELEERGGLDMADDKQVQIALLALLLEKEVISQEIVDETLLRIPPPEPEPEPATEASEASEESGEASGGGEAPAEGGEA